MRYEKTLPVSREVAEEMERICQSPPGSSECSRDTAQFDEEVTFDNGNRVAIQVVSTNDPDTESCWTQGVLFDAKGNELACTDVGESFLHEYYLNDGENEYVVNVELSPTP